MRFQLREVWWSRLVYGIRVLRHEHRLLRERRDIQSVSSFLSQWMGVRGASFNYHPPAELITYERNAFHCTYRIRYSCLRTDDFSEPDFKCADTKAELLTTTLEHGCSVFVIADLKPYCVPYPGPHDDETAIPYPYLLPDQISINGAHFLADASESDGSPNKSTPPFPNWEPFNDAIGHLES